MARIHFVGVGKMGLPMATHLHRAGHSLSVSDTSAQQQTLAAERGLSVMDVIVRETSIGGGIIATPCCRRPVGGSHGEDAMIEAARIFASACTVAARQRKR